MDLGDLKIHSAVSYSGNNSRDRIHGSFSVLHNPTGVSVTFAAGHEDPDSNAPSPDFRYIKLGYQTKELLPYGLTAFSIDYFDGNDTGIAGSDSESFGIYAVQNFDRFNTELYAGYRTYSYDAPGVAFQDVDSFLFGAMFKF